MTTAALTNLGDAITRTAPQWTGPDTYYVMPAGGGWWHLKRRGHVVAYFPDHEWEEALNIASEGNRRLQQERTANHVR